MIQATRQRHNNNNYNNVEKEEVERNRFGFGCGSDMDPIEIPIRTGFVCKFGRSHIFGIWKRQKSVTKIDTLSKMYTRKNVTVCSGII